MRTPGNLLRTALLLLALHAATATAQPLGIAYCDADHLYDTVPSLFYDDTDYTPRGALRWNTERYRRKIARTAALADSLGLPIIALWSVENEAVVRDIAAACQSDYSYLHRTLNSLDGMDFALLYYGDRFFPHYVEPGRRYLYVEGVLRRPAGRGDIRRFRTDTLGLVLCSEQRMVRWVVGDLRDERPGAKLVVMGRLPDRGLEEYGLHDGQAGAASAAAQAGGCATASPSTRPCGPPPPKSTSGASCSTRPERSPCPPISAAATREARATPCPYMFIWNEFGKAELNRYIRNPNGKSGPFRLAGLCRGAKNGTNANNRTTQYNEKLWQTLSESTPSATRKPKETAKCANCSAARVPIWPK